MALLGKRLFGVPYVYDMDSGLAQQMVDRFPALGRVRGLLDFFERRAVRGSCGTLAVCGSLEAQARAFDPRGLVARLEDVSLLGDDEYRSSAESLDLHPPEWAGDPLVLYVGNLQVYQGIDLLLAGFARTVARVPAAKLIVVGGTPEEIGHYRQEAAEAGDRRRRPFRRPPPGRVAGALPPAGDRAGLPPRPGDQHADEGLLLPGLGACRCSPPGCRPIPRCSTTRSLSSSSPTPRRMGRGLARLLEDRELRGRLAGNARQFAQREFTPEAFRRKLLGFYDAVANRILEDGNDGQTTGLQARTPGRS